MNRAVDMYSVDLIWKMYLIHVPWNSDKQFINDS